MAFMSNTGTNNTSAADRIQQVLCAFQGEALTAKQIAAEADCSVSWVYRVLKRLEAAGFAAYSYRDAHGLPTRARRYSVASRDVVADLETEQAAAELVELEAWADDSVEAEYLRSCGLAA